MTLRWYLNISTKKKKNPTNLTILTDIVLYLSPTPGPPGAPGGVRVIDKTDRSVTLQWSRGADNHSPISKYTIQYRDSLVKDSWKNATTCEAAGIFTFKMFCWNTSNNCSVIHLEILKIYSRGHQRGAPGVSGGLNELLNVDPRVFS